MGTLQGPMPALPAHRDERAEWLNRVAHEYPWTTFNVGELSLMLRVDPHIITAVAKYTGERSPFKGKTKRARPETVFAFLEDPPADFEWPDWH